MSYIPQAAIIIVELYPAGGSCLDSLSQLLPARVALFVTSALCVWTMIVGRVPLGSPILLFFSVRPWWIRVQQNHAAGALRSWILSL